MATMLLSLLLDIVLFSNGNNVLFCLCCLILYYSQLATMYSIAIVARYCINATNFLAALILIANKVFSGSSHPDLAHKICDRFDQAL